MTTIIATPTALYADSYCNSAQPFGTTKLHYVKHEKSGEDYLVGGAGYLDELVFMTKLLGEHGLTDLWKLNFHERLPGMQEFGVLNEFDTDILVVTRSKEIFLLSSSFVAMPVNNPVYMIGSGGDWARAFYDLKPDATPEQAIEYAASRDENTKAPVQALKFPRRKRDE